jgi:hypothetical protein
MFLKPIANDPTAAFRGAAAAIATDLAAAQASGVQPLYGRSSALPIVYGNPSVTLYETDPVAGSRIRLTHIVGTRVEEKYNPTARQLERVLSLAPREGFLLSEVAAGQGLTEETSFVDYGAQAETIGAVGFTRTAFPVDDIWRIFVNGIQNILYF